MCLPSMGQMAIMEGFPDFPPLVGRISSADPQTGQIGPRFFGSAYSIGCLYTAHLQISLADLIEDISSHVWIITGLKFT